MELYNFNTAYTHLLELYGIELKPDEFETIGMIGWEKIGNKSIELVNITVPTDEAGIAILPCEANQIEAVYISAPDHQATSNQAISPLTQNQFVESYIEMRKGDNQPALYKGGTFIKYRILDAQRIQTSLHSGYVNIFYKTIVFDEDGLPLLNQKEVDAIAAYCAYAITFKKSVMTRDAATFQMAQVLEQKWLKACDHARTPMYLSQNDMDAIGDVKYSWDRKSYGKSYKPIK